ncbi:MAG: hypothetical protein HYY06_33645 [Deltaproteobacteria bacterium]|nr:hypothetical protein [Deltaproteobacteria bacterium]
MSLGALGLAWLDACGLSEAPRSRDSARGDGREAKSRERETSSEPDSDRNDNGRLIRSLPPGARLVLLLGPWPEVAWPESSGFAVRFVEAGMVPSGRVDVAAIATAIERRARSGQPVDLDGFTEAQVAFLRELLVSLYRTPRAGAALLGQPMPGCLTNES